MKRSESREFGRFEEDAVIARLVPDPARVRDDLSVLAGLVGRCGREDACRVYLTPDLQNHLELPLEAIVHSEPFRPDGMPGRLLWVRYDAEVVATLLGPREAIEAAADALGLDILHGTVKERPDGVAAADVRGGVAACAGALWHGLLVRSGPAGAP